MHSKTILQNKIIIILVVLLIPGMSLYSFGKVKNTTFQPGEKVVYEAAYNWGPLWLNAGEVSFTTSDTVFNGEDAYFIQALGKTHSGYDNFFKVRDTFEVVVHPDSLSTFTYRRSTFEGPTEMQVWFNSDFETQTMLAHKTEPGKDLRTDTFPIHSDGYDVLSAIYAVRNFDFSKVKPGEIIPFKLWVDMGYFDVYVRYRGIEKIKIRGGRRFECLVFSPLLVEGTLFRDGEGMKVYVTNDRNRVPVYIEAKILIGKVKAILKDTENLRHPMDAEIK